MGEEPPERIRELSADERARLFNHLRDDHHALHHFALISGQRLGTLIRATKADVDRENQRLKVRIYKKRGHYEDTWIPLTESAMGILDGEWDNHPIYLFTFEATKDSNGGKRVGGERYPFTQRAVRYELGKALKAAGIEDYRFHDHRHTVGTRATRSTGNILFTQKLLGHASLASTTRYAHVFDKDVRKAMDGADFDIESPQIPRNKARKNSKRGAK